MEETDIRIRERMAERHGETGQEQPAVRDDGVCPHCGAVLDKDYEWCPVCGAKLADYCTFCGAPMLPDDLDCPECGMPADGVVCPDCNVRNFRPFCRQCGRPLSRAARRAVEKAKQDPKVLEAARMRQKAYNYGIEDALDEPEQDEDDGRWDAYA